MWQQIHVNSVWGLFKTLLNNFHNNTDGELATLTRTRPHCTTAALTKNKPHKGIKEMESLKGPQTSW